MINQLKKNEMKNSNSIATLFGKFDRNFPISLTVLFCTLQACNVINWKWYQIMIPMFVWYGLNAVVFWFKVISGIKLVDQVEDSKKNDTE